MNTEADLSGELLDERFHLDAAAGRGRFGTVFRGRDDVRDVPCAVRVVTVPSWGTEMEATVFRRLLREAVLRGHRMGQLQAAIARTYGFAIPEHGEAGDLTYVATAWLEGQTLAAALDHRRGEGLTGRTLVDTVRLLEPVAETLGHLHLLDGVHGALHPYALRVGPEAARTGTETEHVAPEREPDQARLIDAGLEAILRSAVSPSWQGATDAYLAPEQISSSIGDISARTDVHGLALLVIELLADRPPLPLGSESETRERILDAVARPSPRMLGLDVDPLVGDVLSRAVALEPAARFADVMTFWGALKAAMDRGARVTAAAATRSPLRDTVNDTVQVLHVLPNDMPSTRRLDELLDSVSGEPKARPRPLPDDESPAAAAAVPALQPPSTPDAVDAPDAVASVLVEQASVPPPAVPQLIEPAASSMSDLATQPMRVLRDLPAVPATLSPAQPAAPSADEEAAELVRAARAAPTRPPAGRPKATSPAVGTALSAAPRDTPARSASQVTTYLGAAAGVAVGVFLFYKLLAPAGAVAVRPSVEAAAPLTSTAAAPMATPPYDAHAAEQALTALDARLPGCRSAVGPGGKGALHVAFAADGTVSAVALDAPYAGTGRGACIAGLFRTARVPAFVLTGDTPSAEHEFTLAP